MRLWPEKFLYNKIATGVLNEDSRSVLWAIVSAYQDRVQDLRSILTSWEYVWDPESISDSVYRTVFRVPENNNVQTLDIDTYSYIGDGSQSSLISWAASVLGIDEDDVVSVTKSVSDSRILSTAVISELASMVGAARISGRADAAKFLASNFSRLKLKGTAKSYQILGSLLGFDYSGLVPLWSRLSSHNPAEPNHPGNYFDFRNDPQVYPESDNYESQDFSDGDSIVKFTSTGLTTERGTTSYYFDALNSKNPFVKLVYVNDGIETDPASFVNPPTIYHPDPGTYSLSGGGESSYSYVDLPSSNSPDNLSKIRVKALVPGTSYNGVQVLIKADGNLRSISIEDHLSSVKYRSSYFDLHLAYGAERLKDYMIPCQVNQDRISSKLTPFYPEIKGGYADPSMLQLDFSRLSDEANEALSYFDDIRPATRYMRRLGVGILYDDAVRYAPVHGKFEIAFSGESSGTLEIPSYDFYLKCSYTNTENATSSVDAFSDGGIVVGLTSEDVTGTVNISTGEYSFASSNQVVVTIEFVPNNESITPEPESNIESSARPQDEIDDRNGMAWYDTADNYSNMRCLTGSGEDASSNYSENPTITNSSLFVLNENNVTVVPQLLPGDGNRYRIAKGYGLVRANAVYEGNVCRLSCIKGVMLSALDARYLIDDLIMWIPFNEGPVDPLRPYEAVSGLRSTFVSTTISAESRVSDPWSGWALRTSGLTGSASVDVGSTFTLMMFISTDRNPYGEISFGDIRVNFDDEITRISSASSDLSEIDASSSTVVLAAVVVDGCITEVHTGRVGETLSTTPISGVQIDHDGILRISGLGGVTISHLRLYGSAKDVGKIVSPRIEIVDEGRTLITNGTESAEFVVSPSGFAILSESTPSSAIRSEQRLIQYTASSYTGSAPRAKFGMHGGMPVQETFRFSAVSNPVNGDGEFIQTNPSLYENNTRADVYASGNGTVYRVSVSSTYPRSLILTQVDEGGDITQGITVDELENVSVSVPFQMYGMRHSVLNYTDSDVYAGWMNPTKEGMDAGIVLMHDAGQMIWSSDNGIPAGTYEVEINAELIGDDPTFSGFDFEVAIEGTSNYTTATVLGNATIPFEVEEEIIGPWALSLYWSNDGPSRSVKVNSLSMTRIASKLFDVGTDGSVEEVSDVGGSWLCQLNSNGDTISKTAESELGVVNKLTGSSTEIVDHSWVI